MVDGAHRLAAMWYILVPLIAPGLVATGTMGFLASLPLLAAFVVLQRWVVQGMTAGAVK